MNKAFKRFLFTPITIWIILERGMCFYAWSICARCSLRGCLSSQLSWRRNICVTYSDRENTYVSFFWIFFCGILVLLSVSHTLLTHTAIQCLITMVALYCLWRRSYEFIRTLAGSLKAVKSTPVGGSVGRICR